MVNKIIDGISIKINEVFGDEYSIYSEGIEQGFEEPCFFICMLKPSNFDKLGNRSYREYTFDIHYFPRETNEKNFEMNSIAEELFDTLRLIEVSNDLIQGRDMEYEIVDNILHFKVKYKLFVIKEDIENEFMANFSINQKLKR